MFRIAIALLLAAPLVGQTASVTSYGTPCPAGTPQLTTQGLPRLGTTFTITGIGWSRGCSSGVPFSCLGPSFLIFGFSPGNTTVLLPGLIGDGCPVLARPDFVLLGDANGDVNLQIPNRTGLLGLRFNLQAVEAVWGGGVGPPLHFAGVHFTDGVACVIGT